MLNHPRDTSNLARYATCELEHTFNAQVVPIDVDWKTWNESPVLYLAAETEPVITAEECGQLRNFIRAGGLLFTHANGNSKIFNDFAAKLAQRLFPEYPYQDLPPDHPLYSAVQIESAASAAGGEQRCASADGELAARPGKELGRSRLAKSCAGISTGAQHLPLRRRQTRFSQSP